MERQDDQSNAVYYLPVVASGNGQAITPYQPNQVDVVADSDQIDLRGFFRVLRRYKWVIVSILLVFVSLTAVGTLVMHPIYKSTATLEIKPNSGGVKFQSVDLNTDNTQAYFRTQARILQSESVAQAVIDDLKLHEHPEITGEKTQRGLAAGLGQVLATIKSRLQFDKQPVASQGDSESQQTAAMRHRLNRFMSKLSVNADRESYLFQISFESFDPKLAAMVSNSVADQYMKLNDSRRFNSNSSAKEFLAGEIEKVRAKLESSERDLTDFARRNRIVDMEDNSNIMSARMTELSSALTAVQASRIEAASQYEQLTKSGGVESFSQVLQSDVVKNLKSQLATLQAEYERLSKVYKPGYPAMLQLQAQIDDVQRSLNTEVGRIAASLKTNLEDLTKREKLLEAAVEQQKSTLLDLKDRAIQYNILKREWETNRELYAGLLERYKEMGIAGGMELNNVSIVDAAAVPLGPFKPNIPVNLMFAGVAGLLVGVLAAMLLAFLDNTVKTSEALEMITRKTSLGVVPLVVEDEIDSVGGLDLLSENARGHEASEAYRTIRTSLMFSSPDRESNVIMLTSASAGEGKSTTVINLAIVLAQSGSRVAIVDCDLRRARIHSAFGVVSTPGVSGYLAGLNDLNILPTGIENLDIVPAGMAPPNPSELISSSRMDSLLKSLRESYDYVIIDSPPILGLADSIVLSAKVDGAILVVAAGIVPQDAVREAVKRLSAIDARVLGTILNRVNFADDSYNYYNTYYYRYEGTEGSAALGRQSTTS